MALEVCSNRRVKWKCARCGWVYAKWGRCVTLVRTRHALRHVVQVALAITFLAMFNLAAQLGDQLFEFDDGAILLGEQRRGRSRWAASSISYLCCRASNDATSGAT